MSKAKRLIKYIALLVLAVILIILIVPFITPIKVYNPIAGVYLEVHGTYAVAVDYTQEKIIIPSHSLLRPVTKTSTVGVINKGKTIVEELKIPDSITEIGGVSFSGFRKLKKIEGGKNIKNIGGNAFASNHSLSEVSYFEKLEEIGEYAFSDCNLSYLKLPDTVRRIGDCAFQYNKIEKIDADLNNVELGSQVFNNNPFQKKLGEFVIYPDDSLQAYNGNETKIMIPDVVTAVSGAFDNYGEDIDYVEIYVPESVVKIDLFSFRTHCESRIFIPASVTDMRILATGEDQGCFGLHSTIVTTKGSYAEEYAKRFNIDYEIVDKIEYPQSEEEAAISENTYQE